jgi:aminoglycoside phosphotransferase (APT) family kinase protein
VLATNLNRALTRHLGVDGEVRNLVRVTGGATKGTWIFEVAVRGVIQKVVMQLTNASEADDPFMSTKLTAEHDAMVLRAARRQGVAAPEVLAVFDPQDDLGTGHLTRWVAGETLAPKILKDEKFAFARTQVPTQCAQALAAIHAIPTSSLGFLKMMDAAIQWQRYRNIVDQHGVKMPALEWGLRWVQENLPEPVPLSVVHGDFRLGNLIIDDRGLACVIDWELAVQGDPMQDLAWLCLKTWRFGGALPVAGMGERESFYRAYEAASGKSVDPQRVLFWEAFGHVKWAIMCLSMGLGKPDAAQTSVSLEHSVIGRRIEEPLWDLMHLFEARGL